LGKVVQEDELNCGGCGYDTCRKLAAAMLDGRAEPNMCVSYMRKLALNKANALIRAMPSGAVIVDENLAIVDCNRKFAEMLGGETLTVYEAKPGMEGADLRKVVAFHNLFARVLRGDTESVRKDLRHEGLILQVTIFPIEAGHLVGGILQDITEPAVQRERIMQQAQDVIRKNLTTVQQIAYLLGENAADTELMLNGIMNSFRISNPGEAPRKDSLHG
jgi:PAS domain-containing protein